ncbi:hypothetical protein J1N35_031766 [Gossypium stocksii]|uniref:RNase H type-1 domain-containing protein n=1 Tax=Gossypium stocksii TaxID=47602 RepID=A0A9D3V358_9ROSI|nr:hypothetical protein J1N35_031766 [Gossypium stocksii]
MGACIIRNDLIPDSFDAEARAAIHGLRFARDMGFSCEELEGDVRSIVQKLSGSGVDRLSIGGIIADGKALSGFFQQCQFKFITRKGNQAAHYLAKHGFTLENDKFWIEEGCEKARKHLVFDAE